MSYDLAEKVLYVSAGTHTIRLQRALLIYSQQPEPDEIEVSLFCPDYSDSQAVQTKVLTLEDQIADSWYGFLQRWTCNACKDPIPFEVPRRCCFNQLSRAENFQLLRTEQMLHEQGERIAQALQNTILDYLDYQVAKSHFAESSDNTSRRSGRVPATDTKPLEQSCPSDTVLAARNKG